MGIDPQHLKALVDAAVRAPSADNHHHALFELVDTGLRIWADANYVSEREPHRKILTELSFGAILESVIVKAFSLGYMPSWEWRNELGLLGEVRLVPGPKAHAALADALEKRHTNRRFYRSEAAPAEHLDALKQEAARHGDTELVWLEGAPRNVALRLVRLAETERFQRRYLHEELFSAVRFDVGWKAGCEQGLAPAALEVEPGMRAAFRMLGKWEVMRFLTKVGTHHAIGLRAGYLPCKLAPHLAVICTRKAPEPEAVIDVGRAFQRVWLRATTFRLALQPLAASVILPFQSNRDDGATPKLKQTLQSGWHEVLGKGCLPLMLFRMGHAAPPSQVSGRLPRERYLLKRQS